MEESSLLPVVLAMSLAVSALVLARAAVNVWRHGQKPQTARRG